MLVMTLVLTLPPTGPSPAMGGSSWTSTGPSLADGTLVNATSTPSGVRLACDESLLGNWTRKDQWPVPRSGHAMAYDSDNGVSVLFGGQYFSEWDTCYSNETWTYNASTNAWTERHPPTAPSARDCHSMVYDNAGKATVLFGGTYMATVETWTYNMGTDTWTNMDPNIQPGYRFLSAMAYDSANGVVVLFGGANAQNDTWTYNLSKNTWTEMHADPAPHYRWGAAMTYDSASGTMVLFGGQDDVAPFFNDTWTYDFRANKWTQRFPARSPSNRTMHSMAYDSAEGVVVLHGGATLTGSSNETWTYDATLNTWTMKSPPTTPPVRSFQAMVYDSAAERVVLFGGCVNPQKFDDTWTYQAGADTWTRMTPAPPVLNAAAMAFEPTSARTVSFGGWLPDYRGVSQETWTYDLRTAIWTYMHPAKSPSARIFHAMAYDSAEGVVVLFGGNLGEGTRKSDTWTYDFDLNTWTQMHPVSYPSARENAVMAYDSANGFIVLFGGVSLNDTWTYRASTDTWVEKHPATTPPAKGIQTMVYDSASGVMVLFITNAIEYGSLNETWTYNASTDVWTNMTTSISPPGRTGHAMAYDSALGVTLVFGGWWNNTPHDDLWAYKASTNTWTELNPASKPGPRSGSMMVYDSVNDAVVLLGGGYRIICSDTWAYDLKRYTFSGSYTSQAMDSGGDAYFGALSWEGLTSPNTTLSFQFRTADTAAALGSTPFIGPDGTTGTYYNHSGQRLSGTHNGSRWMQYRAYLGTASSAETPLLEGVSIDYNLLQDLSIASPAGGENWTGVQTITWNATDPDGDALTVSILLLNATDSTPLATDIPAAPGTFTWDTMAVPDGEYRIRIIAKDNNASIPLLVNLTSPPFTVFHPNHPPVMSLLAPVDDLEINVSTVRLEWEGSDDDGDALVYFILLASSPFDDTSLPISVATTADTHYDAAGLDNGTYYWTVVAFDGEANSSVPTVRSFTVSIPAPPVNHAPVASLLSPSDGITINNTSVELRWTSSDEDGDNVTFRLYLSPTEFTLATLPGPSSTTDLTTYLATGLLNGTTYWWAVVPTDGLLDGAGAGVRHFAVDITYGNRAPDITSTPILDVMVGSTYSYNLTASDPDGDTLALALVTAPSGMGLNATTWELLWTPTEAGNFTVTVRAHDGKGGVDVQTFSVHVRPKPIPPPPTPPSGSIISITNGTKVTAATTVQGTTTAGTHPVQLVQVRVDEGEWANATGTTEWSYRLDPTDLAIGSHHLSVRAYDGTSWSNLTGVDFTVEAVPEPPISEENAFPWWAVSLMLVLLAVGTVAAVAMRRRRGESSEASIAGPVGEAEVAPPLEVSIGAEAGEEAPGASLAPVEVAQPVDIAAMAAAAPEAPRPSQAAPAVPEQVTAPEPPAPPKPAPVHAAPAAMATAPAGFALEDVFLMYGDGRLIQHSTRRLRADMDVEVMTSMLKAVQDFVKDSIGAAEGAELGAMEYGESKIMLQKGRWVILAAVITGGEPEGFRDEMRAAISNIEGEYRPALEAWDGDTSALAGARRFMSQLGAYRAPEAATGARPDVAVKGELEFYQGFVRLKVAVRNGMDTLIADASFKLVYKDSVLRLDHIEPAYPVKGDEVILGNVEPREKKTIAFYLDPQICTESFVEGVLTYKDARGMLSTVQLPRKLASVVCPIMHTDENINTAMLRRMAAEQLDKRDSKAFIIPLSITPEGAFDIGKSAMQHHDVRLVREFFENEPYVAEAWYYGKVKGRDDRLVLCVRVAEERRVLEFQVASSSTLMLTGMLAELKADLNKELGAQRGRPVMEQLTRADDIAGMVMKRTLLDKAAEAEMGADESDVRR